MSLVPNIVATILFLVTASLVSGPGMVSYSNAQVLSPNFYDASCPKVSYIVRGVVEQVQINDTRIGPKLLRLHFHDCFVNGCDGSLLIDKVDGILESEKEELPNKSTEGYEVVDLIKSALESACPGVVSCADILALASQILVSANGGPKWEVQLGRRDSRTANQAGTTAIPSPFGSLDQITQKFIDAGLDSTDLVALSGAHTFGDAHCPSFDRRLYNFSGTGKPDPSLDPTYLKTLRKNCPLGRRPSARESVNLDPTTPDNFDNIYYKNLQRRRGLFQSDQELYSNGAETVALVDRYAKSQREFFDGFAKSMVKMGNIKPLTGNQGEIRSNCRRPNQMIN